MSANIKDIRDDIRRLVFTTEEQNMAIREEMQKQNMVMMANMQNLQENMQSLQDMFKQFMEMQMKKH